MDQKLKDKRVVVIGGSSGIGFAVAKLALKEKANVIIAGRSQKKLDDAKTRLGSKVEIITVDICNEETVKEFFKKVGRFDHIQIPASEVRTGSFLEFSLATAKESFDSKFWGQYMVIKHAVPHIDKNGSITLYSGALGQRPVVGTVISASISCAVEGLSRALAVELAPLRVNCISPGLTQTELFSTWGEEKTKDFFADRCKKLLIKRPAQPDEIAEAALHLMKNKYSTGTTLYVDGGYTLK